MYLDDGREVITMNYMDNTMCNGNGSAKNVVISQNRAHQIRDAITTTSTSNMNWLIYAFYARHDYTLCRSIIEQQLRNHVDKEYGWRIKGLVARIEGDPIESLQCLQQAININPTQAINYKEIGRTL